MKVDKEKEVLLHARRSSELAASGELPAASSGNFEAKKKEFSKPTKKQKGEYVRPFERRFT